MNNTDIIKELSYLLSVKNKMVGILRKEERHIAFRLITALEKNEDNADRYYQADRYIDLFE